uniref:Lipoxygenase domain-containing protein n=1 Tax=Neobodo designis TaxID=312471 RepID=A0A7S1LYQ7_NEODS|mmetsp:Transcript_30978/g.95674  ORF Transcript_30978/g.95674 Transcript_30978/m.95674 type:complete len:577 (+) Transcript_30978:169-1899(+)
MGCGASKTDNSGLLCLPQDTPKDLLEKRREGLAANKELYVAEVPKDLPNWVKKVPGEEITVKGLWELTKVFYRLQKSYFDQWVERSVNKIEHDERFKEPFGRFEVVFDETNHDKFREVPKVARVWKTDEEFGYQHLNGLIPAFIERCAKIPDNFKVTDDMVNLPEGQTLASLAEGRRLYISDVCETLEDVPTINGNVQCVPMILFVTTFDDRFLPIAITLDRKGGRVYTPKVDTDAVWLAAKVQAMCSEFQVHTLLIHALTEHMMMEPFWIACCQSLSEMHPLHALLDRNMWNMVYVNHGVRASILEDENWTDTKGALQANLQCGKDGSKEILSRMYKSINWGDYFDIPKRWAAKDVGDIKDFRYRDEILKLWDMMHTLCLDFLKALYPTAEALAKDTEVQALGKAMADPQVGDMRGVPVGPGGKIESVEQLALICTMVMFQCGVRHSHVENAAVYYYQWIPLFPASCKIPVPIPEGFTDADIDAGLPNMERTVSQIALIDSVNLENPGEVSRLPDYPKDFMSKAPKGCRKAVDDYVAKLNKYDDEMVADYKKLQGKLLIDVPFLRPRELAQSIWN